MSLRMNLVPKDDTLHLSIQKENLLNFSKINLIIYNDTKRVRNRVKSVKLMQINGGKNVKNDPKNGNKMQITEAKNAKQRKKQ